MMLRLVPASRDHVGFLEANVRDDDRLEWALASGFHGSDNLRGLINLSISLSSPQAYAVVDERGCSLCVFGASPNPASPKDNGMAWLLGTASGVRRARSIQRHWREGLRLLHQRFQVLHAHPLASNLLHIHWMERLGFQLVGKSALYTAAPFLYYRRDKETPLDVLRSR
jgi:hypothetical protein